MRTAREWHTLLMTTPACPLQAHLLIVDDLELILERCSYSSPMFCRFSRSTIFMVDSRMNCMLCVSVAVVSKTKNGLLLSLMQLSNWRAS